MNPMKQFKQILASSALLVLTCSSLAFSMDASPSVPVSFTQQSIYGLDADPDNPHSQTTTYLYDASGLMTSMIMEDSSYPDERSETAIKYELDEMGNPVRITIPFEEEETYVFEIQNSYANPSSGETVLENAVVTDILGDDVSSIEDLQSQMDSASGSAYAYSIVQLLFSCIRYYTGYRDMEFRFADTQALYRYDANGQLIYQGMILPNMFQTITTRYMADGILTMTVNRFYRSDGTEETSTETTETDNNHCMVSLSVESDNSNGQSSETVYFQYDKKMEENTGRIYLSGTIRETSGSIDSLPLPYSLHYYLNDAGTVVQEEIISDTMTKLTDFDEEGRIIRTETDNNTSDMKTIMTYTY